MPALGDLMETNGITTFWLVDEVAEADAGGPRLAQAWPCLRCGVGPARSRRAVDLAAFLLRKLSKR
jgi:hypothetical protein